MRSKDVFKKNFKDVFNSFLNIFTKNGFTKRCFAQKCPDEKACRHSETVK